MQERRSQGYTFGSEKDLIRYFSFFLPAKRVHQVVAFAKKEFVVRKGCSRSEKKLQLLKKCECELNRVVKTELPSA